MAPSVKREDLIVPYIHVSPASDPTAATNVVSQSMPMAAMMMKNKLLSWFTIFSAVGAVLASSHGAKTPEGSQSPFLQLLMAVVGAGVCYLDLLYPSFGGIMPKPASQAAKTATEVVAATATAVAEAAAGTA